MKNVRPGRLLPAFLFRPDLRRATFPPGEWEASGDGANMIGYQIDFYYPDSEPHTIEIAKPTGEVEYHTLDEKYLPDTVFRKSDIIVSQEDLVAGETPLETGRLYFVYE